MGSKNTTSGQFPVVGTSDASSVKAMPVLGAQIMAKKGFGKSGMGYGGHKGNRSHVSETAGAQFKVTATRAIAEPDSRLTQNVRLLPASHTQGGTWRSSFDAFSQGNN